MPRHFAFLRAINVGGHVVKMDVLRAHFENLGVTAVSTFIASGNVVFDSPLKPAALETKIERHLHAALGYEVDTFIRSLDELRAVDADVEQRFGAALAKGANLYVGFLKKLPGPDARERVVALTNGVDVFSFGERELYWLCHTRISDSVVTGPKLAKALGASNTSRNITSLRKFVAAFGK